MQKASTEAFVVDIRPMKSAPMLTSTGFVFGRGLYAPKEKVIYSSRLFDIKAGSVVAASNVTVVRFKGSSESVSSDVDMPTLGTTE